MTSHCIHEHGNLPRFKRAMMSERSPLDAHAQYGGFIEPRQLSLGTKDVRSHTALARDSFVPRSPIDHAEREDHLGRPYGGMEHSRYSPPTRFMGPPSEFTAHGSRADPFLWSGDYGPGPATLPGGPDDYHSMPFDDWRGHDNRHSMSYDPPPFFGHLPGISEMMGHPHMPSMRDSQMQMASLPPFPPISPFRYDGAPGPPHPELFNHPPPPAPMPNEYENPAQMPLLPFINETEFAEQRRPPTQDGQSESTPPLKKSRATVTQRNSKPLQVEELLHDHSRFAKVVKAFLSIEVPEARTVPEISKRVDEMYAGQYTDFEAVKRMVNDVLQKHKAFWHPGRGSPYQLNLGEGRARREFPSSRTRGRGGRAGNDDDDYYGGGPVRTRSKRSTRRAALQDEDYNSMTPSRQNSVEADPDYAPPGELYHPEHDGFMPNQTYVQHQPSEEVPLPPGHGPAQMFDDRKSGFSGNLAMIMNPLPMPPHMRHEEHQDLPIDPALLAVTEVLVGSRSRSNISVDPQLEYRDSRQPHAAYEQSHAHEIVRDEPEETEEPVSPLPAPQEQDDALPEPSREEENHSVPLQEEARPSALPPPEAEGIQPTSAAPAMVDEDEAFTAQARTQTQPSLPRLSLPDSTGASSLAGPKSSVSEKARSLVPPPNICPSPVFKSAPGQPFSTTEEPSSRSEPTLFADAVSEDPASTIDVARLESPESKSLPTSTFNFPQEVTTTTNKILIPSQTRESTTEPMDISSDGEEERRKAVDNFNGSS